MSENSGFARVLSGFANGFKVHKTSDSTDITHPDFEGFSLKVRRYSYDQFYFSCPNTARKKDEFDCSRHTTIQQTRQGLVYRCRLHPAYWITISN